jgi:hypothetical protein
MIPRAGARASGRKFPGAGDGFYRISGARGGFFWLFLGTWVGGVERAIGGGCLQFRNLFEILPGDRGRAAQVDSLPVSGAIRLMSRRAVAHFR